MEGIAGIGITVLMAICVGTLSYFLVSLIKLNMAPVAAVFTTIFFGFSTAGDRPTETVVGLLIFGVPAYLFFTIFPFLENFVIDTSTFFLGATTGIILGWCIAKLFKLILGFLGGGKEGRAWLALVPKSLGLTILKRKIGLFLLEVANNSLEQTGTTCAVSGKGLMVVDIFTACCSAQTLYGMIRRGNNGFFHIRFKKSDI